MNHRVWIVLIACCWCLRLGAAQTDYAEHIASLIGPAKPATPGQRGPNRPRDSYGPWGAACTSPAGAQSPSTQTTYF